ncbi:hypothetical protein DPE81_23710 [Salmonella enterica subsp. enterica]|nr:hypothetical protein [Salmonella enterica]EBG5100194.1 hypothetical protein [Salmonella enterica subsp. enterica serovar India]ECI4111902.1 hypothetical protein [Salmonella enterica subsp. enterica]EGM1791525.1 hypothetical protein [Salmonella enterica subsp. enterica]EGR9490037.1 hypothetical protein [Salmonella enterica subsp. enterica]
MAIYIRIDKHYETTEVVAYKYSYSDGLWGEFFISKNNFELHAIKEAKGEENNFYMLRAWSKVKKEFISSGLFPEKTCYAA